MAQQYFQLDSGVLQQYGRPPTPSVTKDAFGSAMRGVETGMRMGYAYDANRRANEELEEKKKTRDDVRKRWEEEQRLAKEKEATRIEEKKREQDRLEASAAQAKLESDARIQNSAIQRQTAQHNLAAARTSQKIAADIRDDKEVLETIKRSVEQSMDMTTALPSDVARATLDAVYDSGERIDPDIMDSLRDEAILGTQGRMDANNQLAMWTVQSLTQNDPVGGAGHLNRLMPDVNVLNAELLPPNKEDQQGQNGYVRYEFTTKDNLEKQEATTPVDRLLSNVPDWQNRIANSTTSYINNEKRAEDEKKRAFTSTRMAWNATLDAENNARKVAIDITDKNLSDGHGWLNVYYPEFMGSLSPEEQPVSAASITKAALSLYSLPAAPDLDQVMEDVTNEYISSQSNRGKRRKEYKWYNKLFNSYSNDKISPAASADLTTDIQGPINKPTPSRKRNSSKVDTKGNSGDITEDNIQFTMKEMNLSREEVLEALMITEEDVQ